MKVIAFNGSPREDGNTGILLRRVLKVMEEEGIKIELIHVAARPIRGCTACKVCCDMKNEKCVIEDDQINDYVAKIKAADGIILGSPTYFSMMTPEMKAFIDRTGYIARANGHLFRRKVAAAVVAVRRAGGIPTFDAINHYFLINQMIVPGSSYWNIGVGNKKGEVADDDEGLKTMDTLGKNMAWLIKKLRKGRKKEAE